MEQMRTKLFLNNVFILNRYPPDGFLTTEHSDHDVDLDPAIIDPDPFTSDDCLNVFSPIHQFLLTK